MENKKSAGFTLMEMVVAIGIFSIVMTVAVTFFNQALQGQRRTLSSQLVQDNMRYAIEYMSREIRMGSGFSSPNLSQLNFTNSNGDKIIYSLSASGQIMRSINDLTNATAKPLISANISILSLKFVLSLALQPRITIITKGEISGGIKPEEQIPLIVQTTISPRNLQ